MIRAISGAISTMVILAMLFEPLKSWGRLVPICAAILVVSVWTARNRMAVIYAIIFIIASRLVIGGGLALARHFAH